MEYGLAVLVFFPFVAGLLVYSVGKAASKDAAAGSGDGAGRSESRGLCGTMAAIFAVLEFLLMVVYAFLFHRHFQMMMPVSWVGNKELVIEFTANHVCGLGLHFRMDDFRMIYGGIAAFMWMMATLMSGEYFQGHRNVRRFYLFLLVTLGATMGVFLSADLFTTFIFFEIMSFTSYVWVAQEENAPALRAAGTYLAVAVTGGLVMLMGIFLLYHQLGTLEIAALRWAASKISDKSVIYVAGGCMLFGFGAKAGAFPLHIWLPKAHPVAPAPASALLSGILTKTGIYGILILSCQLFLYDGAWGAVILALGVGTMLTGAVLAVFSVDLKRTLACSSVSQIGFILVGVGMQCLLEERNEIAIRGTLLHMINHSLIKLVLFLAAGVIYRNTHDLDLNRIRGYGRRKPLLAGIFLTGALAIGGIPMFGGYISKTLLHEAILEYGGGGLMKAVEWTFLFSGGLTVAYMTKLFAAIFVEKNRDAALQARYDGGTGAADGMGQEETGRGKAREKSRRYMNGTTAFALTSSALALLVWGLFPYKLMNRVAMLAQDFMNPYDGGHSVNYFSPANLSGALISVAIGAAVYLLFIRKVLIKDRSYVNMWPERLDLEELLYRPLLLKILPVLCGVVCRIFDSFLDGLVVLLRMTVYRDSPLPCERVEGNALTAALGRVLNGLKNIGNRTWRRKAPRQIDFVHYLAVKNDELKEDSRIIGRSLSFGLLLFCIGLSLTLIYLLH